MSTPDLQKLLICRDILADDSIRLFCELSKNPADADLQYSLAGTLIAQAEKKNFSGNLLRAQLLYLLSQGKNAAAQTTERTNGRSGTGLHQAFSHDMEIIWPLLKEKDLPDILGDTKKLLSAYIPTDSKLPENLQFLDSAVSSAGTAADLALILLDYYHRYGCGEIASHRAFCWDSLQQALVGIRHFEDIAFSDLVGYERQKKLLLENTAAFAAGKPANNVLLVGARGTGKSSSVKALANTFYAQGLRLLQLTKKQLTELPKVMSDLRRHPGKKFVLFLDDLSFEEFEVEYKYLKSAIEGGVEARPENVLIYATSNRRHLIKETWKDRADSQEELYRNDSVNETVSLSDRFGLIINYTAPNQSEYLAIIEHLLKKADVALSDEELRLQALRWELTHSGRSGRVAQQFVTHYLGQQSGL